VPPACQADGGGNFVKVDGMFDSIPLAWRAILWPLLGAALIVGLRRVLPNWLRRSLAALATLASLVTLWSLRNGEAARLMLSWEPINLFRTSPFLQPGSQSLWAGILLCGLTLLLLVGIRGVEPNRTLWHGLILVALAGILILTLSPSLVVLALGSALLDLTLLALATCAPGDSGRVVWRMAVPGLASTLLLFVAALRLDTELGSASLLARDLPAQILLLVGAAGALRLLVFPLHPRGLALPESATTLLLPLGAGVLLLDRAQVLGPVLTVYPWLLVLAGVALLAGGLLAWAGNSWTGIAIHQTGWVLAAALLRASTAWSLASLALSLGILAIWGDACSEFEPSPRAAWQERILGWLAGRWDRVRGAVAARWPRIARWRASWLGQRASALLPLIALGSVAGVPLTAGAVGRWSFYAALLGRQEAVLLPLALIADVLLVAGLWVALDTILKQASEHKVGVASLLAMLLLAAGIVLLGLAPGRVGGSLGIKVAERPDVSAWGLGFLYVVPWLLGTWLAHLRLRLGRQLDLVGQLAGLDWLYRAGSWLGQRLASGVYWLGLVGEGEGWWGWALVILAVGAIVLINP